MKKIKRHSVRRVLGAWALAAAVLLAGCGGPADSADSPKPQGSGQQSTQNEQSARKDRITEQWSAEKVIQDEWGQVQKISIHVPKLECDTPDAARLNDLLYTYYGAQYQDYTECPEAESTEDIYLETTIDWDAYWYGDCVSIVIEQYYGGPERPYYDGYCFDFDKGVELSTTEMLTRMGLDPDAAQTQVYRQAVQNFDRDMDEHGYTDGAHSSGTISNQRLGTLTANGLDDLPVVVDDAGQVRLLTGYATNAGRGWNDLEVVLVQDPSTGSAPLTAADRGVTVRLEGDTREITIRRTPELAALEELYGIQLEEEKTYPILGTYSDYVDVKIGDRGSDAFLPMVYLLTKDGLVEYVDLTRCLRFGGAMVCHDPIYIPDQGVELVQEDRDVALRCADGTVTLLNELVEEWNVQDIPHTAVGAFNYTTDTSWDWMDVNSNGFFQMGVKDNHDFYHGNVEYLGVIPEGAVLGVSTYDTEDGKPGIDFIAAIREEPGTENMIFTMLAGENPFIDNSDVLIMTRSYG